MVQIIPIDTPTLGDRSYLVHDGQVAFVVDPQRDIDRVLRLAAEAGVRITHVFETHIHNDYVTGGHALARATGAAYHVNAADPVAFDHVGLSDGDVVGVGTTHAGQGAGHPRPHPHPPVLRAGPRRPPGRGVHRRLPALRLGRPARPTRPRPHPHPGTPPVRLRPPAGPRPARPRRGVPDPRVRQLLLGHPERGIGLHHRPGTPHQPGPDPRRAVLCGQPAGRTGRVARLLRAHGAGQHGRAAGSRT